MSIPNSDTKGVFAMRYAQMRCHYKRAASAAVNLQWRESKTMTNKPKKNVFVGSLEHRGGKKLSQQGTEFFHKMREVRKHPTGGYRVKKG